MIGRCILCVVALLSAPAWGKDRHARHAANIHVKPPVVVLHDRPPLPTCRINWNDQLRMARRLPVATYPIDGKDAQKFLDVFNKVDPPTDFKAERVLVVEFGDFAQVELFTDGCLIPDGEGKLAPAGLDALMWQAFGTATPNATAM